MNGVTWHLNSLLVNTNSTQEHANKCVACSRKHTLKISLSLPPSPSLSPRAEGASYRLIRWYFQSSLGILLLLPTVGVREVFLFVRYHGGKYGYRVPSRPAGDAGGVNPPNRSEERQRGGKDGEFHGRRAVAVHHFTVQPQDQALESLQRCKCWLGDPL